jgi:hypothetical protein
MPFDLCGPLFLTFFPFSAGISDAFPQFNKKYGRPLPDGSYQIPAPWQAGLSNVSMAF